MEIKITRTEPYKDSENRETIVCRGRLMLVDINNLPKYKNKNVSVSFSNTNTYIPIIISETEPIQVSDKIYNNHFKEIQEVKSSWRLDLINRDIHDGFGNDRKIIAMPEQFSPKHIQAILDHQLKHRDTVFIQCHGACSNVMMNMPWHYSVKLNKDNRIKLFRINQKESWDEILGAYESSEWRSSPFINYLRAYYNVPTRK